MHFTLGVMSLRDSDNAEADEGQNSATPRKSVNDAIAFLHQLRPRLLKVIQEAYDTMGEPETKRDDKSGFPAPKLAVRFDEIDVMKVERRKDGRRQGQGGSSNGEADAGGNSEERMAHVMYIGPSRDWEGYEGLKRVCSKYDLN